MLRNGIHAFSTNRDVHRPDAQGRREVFEAQGQNCKTRPLVSAIEHKGRRGRKQGNLWELNLEAFLEPCRLLLLGGSLNTPKEALNKNFDICC